MADYDRIVDLTLEVAEARNECRAVTDAYFELREQHLTQSRWWTRAGAGSAQELAAELHDALSADRRGLRDYWYFPSGKHNPYLDLLHAAMPAVGYRPRELAHLDDVVGLDPPSVLHMHWIESLRSNGTDGAENQVALDRARRSIDAFVAGPANRLIWTVHEPLPHESRWPEQDAGFHQYLADTAHGIHILHQSTIEACAPHFDLDPAKTFEVRHPLYTGVYADYRQRRSARALLGLHDDELAVVSIGALRPYKGLDDLLDATAEVASSRPLRLLVAGMPVGDVERFLSRCERFGHVGVAPMLVPDSEIQTMLRAADVVAIPYRRFLNSAVLMLALSFGVPVLAIENPVTVDARSSGLVTTFATVDELVTLLGRAEVDPQADIDPGFAATHAPATIAAAFAAAVTQRLEDA